MAGRTFYISEVNGDTSFQNVTLQVLSGGIIGVSNVSGMRVLNEIQNTFFNHEEIKKIFALEDNGLKMKAISKRELDNAIRGHTVEIRSIAYAFYLAINSSKLIM